MKKLLFGLGLAWILAACQGALPPTITAFEATALPLGGGTAKLSWTVTGADSLEIDGGIGVVTGVTSKDVSLVSSQAFTLTAKNSSGSVTKKVNASVAVLPASGGKFQITN